MTHEPRKILAVLGETAEGSDLKGILAQSGEDYLIETAASPLQVLDVIYSDPPDLLVIGESIGEEKWVSLCRRVKADTNFGHLPIILLLQMNTEQAGMKWGELPVDDYLNPPLHPDEVLSRLSLVFARTTRVRDANPLTRLPGNYSIMKEIEACIESGDTFSVAYVDLDNFKSFNDRYGFFRGDQIIKMTARILTNSVRRLHLSNGFVGHVGGDDFVFIVPASKMESVCREIVAHFDLIVGDFYDEGDKARGFISAKNRKGEEETFPLVSLSIAIVTNEYRPIEHIGEVSAIAAEVKKHVKSLPGSNYYTDRRGG